MKRHPVVQHYLEANEDVVTMAAWMARHKDGAGSLAGRFILAINDVEGHSIDPLLVEASHLELQGLDPELRLLLLSCWARALRYKPERQAERELLLARAVQEVSRNSAPEIRALVAREASTQEGHAWHLTALKKILSMIPRNRPRWATFATNHLNELSNQARLSEGEDEARFLEEEGPAWCRDLLTYFRHMNWVLTTATSTAFKVPHHIKPRIRDELAKGRREIMDCFSGAPYAGILPPRPPAETRNGWVESVTLIRQERTGDALSWARAHEASGIDRVDPFFSALHVLIRAELAAGNPAAALSLLKDRTTRGDAHWLDDLYLSQGLFLAGRRPEALEAMARLLETVARHDAGGRLEFELALSPLKRGDLLSLMVRHSGGTPPTQHPTPHSRELNARRPDKGLGRLLGTSTTMKEFRRLLRKAAPHDLTVLIRGETGTGKELAARALHEESPRAGEPFVAVNCGAIPENLMASELFGHAKGAFTGADKERKGAFEEAGAGTLFLDEIGDITPTTQIALLRVLEAREIVRVGSHRPIRVECRIIAATHVNLEALVKSGRFREDLLYRLNRLELLIPPLRERRDDIIPLARAFLAEGLGQPATLSKSLEKLLARSPWPGNVRQLRNEMEHLRIMSSQSEHYDVSDLPPRLAVLLGAKPPTKLPPSESFSTGEVTEAVASISPFEKLDQAVAANVRLSLRRHDVMVEMFRRHLKLTRKELASALGVSSRTLSEDLDRLIQEGLIRRVAPTRSPRSRYFELVASAPPR